MTPTATQSAVPAPAFERRDDIGRLVAVTWHGAGASADADTAGGRWLVAVDGSECSLRTIATAVQLVGLGRQGGGEDENESEVDLVHVQPWLVKEAAETELPRRAWAATAQARELLNAAQIRWRLHIVFGEAAPEIAGMAKALGSRAIAIGSHGLTAASSVLLGSVAYKVVHLAKLPVLIVR